MSQLPAFDPGFATAETVAIFHPDAFVRRLLEVEAAIAAAQAELGVIDPADASRIAAACRDAGDLDTWEVLTEGWQAGTPLIPLLAWIRARLPDTASAALHQGVTTQDVVDTALMLQAQAGLGVVDDLLIRAGVALVARAQRHRYWPVRSRTFLQPGDPTTVGARMARWAAPLLDCSTEIRRLAGSLPVQLAGPTGDASSFGGGADALRQLVATRLGLVAVDPAWSADRSAVVAAARAVERPARWGAKIALDLAILAQPEIGEVVLRAGGSSSMPGKRNPADSMRAAAAADACSGALSILGRGHQGELERGFGGWHAERLAVPLVFHTGAAALEALVAVLDGAEVVRGNRDHAAEPVRAAADRLVDSVAAALGRLREHG